MASAVPGTLKIYGGSWTSVWLDSSGKQRTRRFGNAKKVNRRDAQSKYSEWLKTWTADPVVQNYKKHRITVGELADRYTAHVADTQPPPHPSRAGGAGSAVATSARPGT